MRACDYEMQPIIFVTSYFHSTFFYFFGHILDRRFQESCGPYKRGLTPLGCYSHSATSSSMRMTSSCIILILLALSLAVAMPIIVPDDPIHLMDIPGEEVAPIIDAMVRAGTYTPQSFAAAGPDPRKHAIAKRTQYGGDDRVIITSSAYPNSMVGRIDTAGGFICTGTLVGANMVLTASHCMRWKNGTFGWVSFRPAYDDGAAPYGVGYATKVWYWKQNGDSLYPSDQAFDYVVARLDKSFGPEVSFSGIQTYQTSWNNQRIFTHFGYPCCENAVKCAYNCEKKVTTTAKFLSAQSYSCKSNTICSGQTGLAMKHCSDIAGGQSGGPFLFQDNDSLYYVVGVQSTHGSAGPGTQTKCPSNSENANGAAGGSSLVQLVIYARSQSQ
eukprot:TRINITY_DN8206_c0_g1_i1.p1 TRINITY_DN8206_c0_g1~~TRINITY_DN8206_c0_g1_i1.p1  ORF type:complete len:385 (+),score=21.95 TRINITY_DN8206_c0_g1_i1:444-1598(+)